MTHVIRVEGFANGAPCPHAGMYVESGDHEAFGGAGHFEFTADPRAAMQFATAGEAIEFYRRVPRCKPVREDGKPNRPMTCSTVTIMNTDEALKEWDASFPDDYEPDPDRRYDEKKNGDLDPL